MQTRYYERKNIQCFGWGTICFTKMLPIFRDMCCQPVYIVTVHPCENYTLIEAIGIQCATPVLAKLMSPKDQMEFCQYDHFECTLFDLKTFTCKKRIRHSSHLKIKKHNLAKLM